MELNIPREASALISALATEADHGIKLNTDGRLPFECLSVALEPHLIEGVHAVDGDILIID